VRPLPATAPRGATLAPKVLSAPLFWNIILWLARQFILHWHWNGIAGGKLAAWVYV